MLPLQLTGHHSAVSTWAKHLGLLGVMLAVLRLCCRVCTCVCAQTCVKAHACVCIYVCARGCVDVCPCMLCVHVCARVSAQLPSALNTVLFPTQHSGQGQPGAPRPAPNKQLKTSPASLISARHGTGCRSTAPAARSRPNTAPRGPSGAITQRSEHGDAIEIRAGPRVSAAGPQCCPIGTISVLLRCGDTAGTQRGGVGTQWGCNGGAVWTQWGRGGDTVGT